MISTELLNRWAASWSAFMVQGLIEATVLLFVVGLPWLLLRRRLSAQLSYGLFVLILLKLVVPIPLTVPAWLAQLSPRHAADRLAGWGLPEESMLLIPTRPDLLPPLLRAATDPQPDVEQPTA